MAFYHLYSPKECIKNAGEKLFSILLNLPLGIETLDAARLRAFNIMVAKKSKVIECSSLPPTSAAAEQHSFGVYNQIQT